MSFLSLTGLAVAVAPTSGSTSSAATTSGGPAMTPAQVVMATELAEAEALQSIPTPSGPPSSPAADPTAAKGVPGAGFVWPANVSSVTAIATTRDQAIAYVPSVPAGDSEVVIVVRMLGNFSQVTTGPPGSAGFATGTEMTIVASSATDVLDFTMQPTATPTALPNSTVIFQR